MLKLLSLFVCANLIALGSWELAKYITNHQYSLACLLMILMIGSFYMTSDVILNDPGTS